MASILHGLLIGPLASTLDERRATTVPAVVIGHTWDLIHPFDDAENLAEQLPNARLVRAHWPFELRMRPHRLSRRDRRLPRRRLARRVPSSAPTHERSAAEGMRGWQRRAGSRRRRRRRRQAARMWSSSSGDAVRRSRAMARCSSWRTRSLVTPSVAATCSRLRGSPSPRPNRSRTTSGQPGRQAGDQPGHVGGQVLTGDLVVRGRAAGRRAAPRRARARRRRPRSTARRSPREGRGRRGPARRRCRWPRPAPRTWPAGAARPAAPRECGPAPGVRSRGAPGGRIDRDESKARRIDWRIHHTA